MTVYDRPMQLHLEVVVADITTLQSYWTLYAVGLAYAARGDNPAARRYLEGFLKAKPELETALEVEALLAAMEA